MNKKWYLIIALISFYTTTVYSGGTETGCATCLQTHVQQYFNTKQNCYENCIQNNRSTTCINTCNNTPTPMSICQPQYSDCATAITTGCSSCVQGAAPFYTWLIGTAPSLCSQQCGDSQSCNDWCNSTFPKPGTTGTSVPDPVGMCTALGYTDSDCQSAISGGGSPPCPARSLCEAGCAEGPTANLFKCLENCYVKTVNICPTSSSTSTSTSTGTQELLVEPARRTRR